MRHKGQLDDINVVPPVVFFDQDGTVTGEWTFSTHPLGIDHDQLDNDFLTSEHFTEASIDHTNITNRGSNTHAQIDTHIASVANPHSVTLAQAGGDAYAEIYNKDEAANTIELDADLADVIIPFANNGLSNNCTADQANNKITITAMGIYSVKVSITAAIDAGATTILETHGHLNGAIQPQIHAHRSMLTSAPEGSISMSGLIDVTTVPWDLDLRANVSDSTARDVTFSDTNLSVMRIGAT